MTDQKLPLGILISGMLLYASLMSPFSQYMQNKPVEEKLGYIPNLQVIRLLCAEQKELAGASLLIKVVMYFGGETIKNSENVVVNQLDFQEMDRVIQIALRLDPYNLDGYYFAQSILVWDMKQYQAATNLLEYGMKYRTWDWYLPFSAGFNYAYFLKDYKKAAAMYMRAGEISGDPLFSRLAGSYLQQSGQTATAIIYLDMQAKNAHDQNVKNLLQIRINALKELYLIEKARDKYLAEMKQLPSGIEELVVKQYLTHRPVDPYGGKFYLNLDGTVASTSKFSFKSTKLEDN